jgi:REP element-mobilizing transposase RayT
VVGRCNNREFCFATPADFHMLIAQLAEMARTYKVTLYAYTLMANHVHLLLRAPYMAPLARAPDRPASVIGGGSVAKGIGLLLGGRV